MIKQKIINALFNAFRIKDLLTMNIDVSIESLNSWVRYNLDINDTPFIALSLAIKADGIWTEDKAIFKQSVIKVYSTKDLIKKLK